MNISIVIPLHRNYKLCLKLFRSLKQFKRKNNFEVVFVLNSSVETNALNSEFIKSKKFPNVRVILLKPCIASVARNIGISSSSGDYILFIDDDDFVSKKMFKILPDLTKKFPNVDVFFYQHIIYYSHFKKIKVNNNIEKNRLLDRLNIENNIIPSFLGFKNEFNLQPCVWLSLFKKNFLIEYNILFDEQRSHGEDWKFMLFILKNAQSLYFIDDYFYYYVRNSNLNVTSSFNPTYFIDSVTDRYLCMNLFPQFNWNSEERISTHIDKFINSIAYYKKFLNGKDLVNQLCIIYDTYIQYNICNLPCKEKRHLDLKNAVSKGKTYFVEFFQGH